MEKYKKILILLSVIIGISIGSLVYENEVAIGEPFVQCEAYGEFDYVKLSNREFSIYLTESDSHCIESLGWFSADYLEIDVVVVIDGIEYERSMFCHKEGSSELKVESVTIVFSFYMEENISTFRTVEVGMFVVVVTTFITVFALWAIDDIVQNKRRGSTMIEM